MVATARMKFALEARPNQYIVPLGNTEPTCMPLSGHLWTYGYKNWLVSKVRTFVLYT